MKCNTFGSSHDTLECTPWQEDQISDFCNREYCYFLRFFLHGNDNITSTERIHLQQKSQTLIHISSVLQGMLCRSQIENKKQNGILCAQFMDKISQSFLTTCCCFFNKIAFKAVNSIKCISCPKIIQYFFFKVTRTTCLRPLISTELKKGK